ncbi:hypothetical protein AAFF_G00160770 [Aldrovandia affinis]|uniref:PHD-type domain-containing protein n=1 Tax=Aldrovandia affinis TaxID=143900 RepID=A0AAD7RN26_9TELE|nr:hypothetical protein AAFF_G00160770 [Aldrovandia affinis]
MQSFRERSGFHGNQHCYQQEPHHESSRLEGYRHHHGDGAGGHGGGRGYQEAGSAAAGGGSKDCYGLPAYQGYAGDAAPPKKQYKEGKVSVSAQQHLQAGGYANHNPGGLGPAYPAQYLSEGHLQQKWPDSALLAPHYEQEASGTVGGPGAPAYSPLPHCYKGYSIPPSPAQYGRQLGPGGGGSGGGLKPSPYRSQSSYAYPQPPARPGYEQLPALAGIPTAQDSLAKYQHFGPPQQSYCLPDVSVRLPEQYYQNCSPGGAGHSPARSLGRSPSYSSTPSPLMEQGLLMPPHSHASVSVSQAVSYAAPGPPTATKERFPEKLLSNPSLWSLNALTSQVESISNNVQQLLLSEALVGGRRAGRRGAGAKKGDEFKAQTHEDASCSDAQSRGPLPETYGAPQPDPVDFQEAGYSSSPDEQLERSYYYCGGQSRSPAGSRHTLDGAPSCSLTSPDDASAKPEDRVGGLHGRDGGSSVAGLHGATHRERLDSTPRLTAAQARGGSLMRGIGEDQRSPPSGVVVPSPLRPQQGSPADMQGPRASLKETTFEGNPWSLIEREGVGKEKAAIDRDGKPEFAEGAEQQQGGWPDEDKCSSLFHKVDKVLMSKSFPGDLEEKIYRELQNQYYSHERESAEKASYPGAYSCDKDMHPAIKTETYKPELPTDYEALGRTAPFVWRDDLSQQDHYLPVKAEDLGQRPQLCSGVERFEEKLFLVTEEDKKREALEEQRPVPEPEGRAPSLGTGEIRGLAEKRGDELPPSADVLGVAVEPPVEERRSAARDAMASSYPVETVFPLQGEQAAPPTPARGHLDRRDAEVLEPDSPQLPGKSVLHPAPSWADTPPSPKKGDDDIEPGISCPSAVMPSPSAKSEPAAPSANLGALHRKHARGRRGRPGRPTHVGVRIRALPGAEDKGAPPVIASSKSTLLPDEMEVDGKELSGQVPKLSAAAEGFPSRMRTRSFTTQVAPKVCAAHLKRRPGPKPSDGTCPVADPPSHPKSLITKIKLMKQRGLAQGAVSHAKGKRGPAVGDRPDESRETPPLPTPNPVKDQKSMVLRSRKQTDETPAKEKEKEKEKEKRPKPTETKKQKAICPKDQQGTIPKPNLSTALQKGVYKPPVGKPEEKSVPVANKRKSSFQSPVPLKKQKWVKGSNVEARDPPVETTATGVRGPKRKPKRGEHLKVSPSPKILRSPPATRWTSPAFPLSVPQKPSICPREKVEWKACCRAAIQCQRPPTPRRRFWRKRTPANPPPPRRKEKKKGAGTCRASPWERTARRAAKPPVPGGGEGVRGSEAVPEAVPEAVLETTPEAVPKATSKTAPEVASLIVNTPRLAKQRAIKNNHEMHMKQRRKRRKGPTAAEQQDLPPPALPTPALPPALPPVLPPALPPASIQPPDSASPTASTPPLVPAPPICTEGPKVDVLTPSNAKVCKRGRPPRTPPAKRGRGKGSGKQSCQKVTAVTVTVPKKKPKTETSDDVDADVKKVPKLKVRHRKRCADHVSVAMEQEEEEKRAVLPPRRKPRRSKSRGGDLPFRPYVRMDGSEAPPSHCTVVNRLEDDLLLRQRRRKRKRCSALLTVPTNPSGVPKATAASSAAMLQGPWKALTVRLKPEPKEAGGEERAEEKEEEEKEEEKEGAIVAAPSVNPPGKTEGGKDLGRRGRPRRSAGGGPRRDRGRRRRRRRRPSFREQYRRLRLLQGGAGAGGGAGMRRLQREAESKEHWAHEACIVWTAGVVLLAGKLYGLSEATRLAARTDCSVCRRVGATISCRRQGCAQIFHFICAKDSGCLLQEEKFSLKCTEHKDM